MLQTNVEPENGGGSFSMTALMEDANATQPVAVGATSTPPPLPGSGGETFPDPLANLPEWMRLIDGVRSMHTNNGGPIRARIMEAVTKAEDQDVKDALDATLNEGTYKSNAAGPTKKAALAVLSKFCPPGVVLPEVSAAAARPRLKVATPSAAKSTSASKSSRGNLPDFPLGPEGRPLWKDVVDSVKGMATNNGGPIRQRIKEAINAAEGEPEVQEELKRAFGEGVYKSNAAGPMKNIALQVLQKFHPGYKASPRVSTRPPETASPATTPQMPAGTPTGVTPGILPQPMGTSMALPMTPQPDPNTLTITFQNMAHPFPCFPPHSLQAVLQFVNDQVRRGPAPLAISSLPSIVGIGLVVCAARHSAASGHIPLALFPRVALSSWIVIELISVHRPCITL
ncbi:hypothetical protein CYMTET_29924 [Cymbomonas tetramitiformis]|uniref:Uncharacterized protein n=1 Tax=Cymbomonas tetramitiformis TaxID=36881 RepID=A0AAE0FK14_9CHLO|nr:hypothetical protein CYMTET_29924 [Cymbomonas tetramitiformis]